MRIGALEAGGTKMVCAVGDENGKINERVTFPTKTPATTMPDIFAWFQEREIEALGIGCFGPLDLNKKSLKYGHITSTPKVSWRDFDIVGYFNDLDIPVGFDTDVNASCLGEAAWGCTKDVDSSIYITVGTGIGVGIMVENRLLHGLTHPEAGHILVSRAPNDDYPGVCPYHREPFFCLEGMASGPAITGRWGLSGDELKNRPEVWGLEAFYLSQALMNYIVTLSPKRIVLGGGVMKQKQLFPLIREKTVALINGYVPLPDPEFFIVPPALGDDQGIMGAIKLALIQTQTNLP
ncbi:MAG: ROK family protein [Lachnospiraceae bacterium]|nr:ROK family protein [Lachnospiraceae bacterium]